MGVGAGFLQPGGDALVEGGAADRGADLAFQADRHGAALEGGAVLLGQADRGMGHLVGQDVGGALGVGDAPRDHQLVDQAGLAIGVVAAGHDIFTKELMEEYTNIVMNENPKYSRWLTEVY